MLSSSFTSAEMPASDAGDVPVFIVSLRRRGSKQGASAQADFAGCGKVLPQVKLRVFANRGARFSKAPRLHEKRRRGENTAAFSERPQRSTDALRKKIAAALFRLVLRRLRGQRLVFEPDVFLPRAFVEPHVRVAGDVLEIEAQQAAFARGAAVGR